MIKMYVLELTSQEAQLFLDLANRGFVPKITAAAIRRQIQAQDEARAKRTESEAR